MKSYNGLFARMLEPAEIEAAIIEAAKHKTRRKPVRRALADLPGEVKRLGKALATHTWQPPAHNKELRIDGSQHKKREIVKPQFEEQIVHHLLVRQLKPILLPRVHPHTSGALPGQNGAKGKGVLAAARMLTTWCRRYRGRKFYVAELDIKGCYDNVDLDILEGVVKRYVRDKEFMQLLSLVLRQAGPGLPKGFYSSPFLLEFYLLGLDRFIRNELKPDHYWRHVDNMFIFGRNKKRLRSQAAAINEYLQKNLRMRLNRHTQVFLFERAAPGKRKGVRGRAINCLGYVIHRDRRTLRKSILKRSRQRANRIRKRGRLRCRDAQAMLSYLGWYKHADVRGYFLKWIKPIVSERQCKRVVSMAARREASRQDGS